MSAELTVIMVSFNTRELTLKALETLFHNAGDVAMQVVVWDNASKDGSADAIAGSFPEVRLVRSAKNIGFAAANNAVADQVDTPWLLLLNPDTETHPRAVENLLSFAKAHPQAGITGGRTLFPDGSLNPSSCWDHQTVWSLFCSVTGLSAAFPETTVFNPEAMGGWQRDTIRHIPIVSGCFFMLRKELWRELGGFRQKYWMYGEEADMCLRAAKLGYRPMITPHAQIMHLVGASSANSADKQVKVRRAKTTLVRDHWPRWKVPIGLALHWMWGASRRAASSVLGGLGAMDRERRDHWKSVWGQRSIWMRGYETKEPGPPSAS